MTKKLIDGAEASNLIFCLFVVVGGLLCTTSFLVWFFGLGFVVGVCFGLCSGCEGCDKQLPAFSKEKTCLYRERRSDCNIYLKRLTRFKFGDA